MAFPDNPELLMRSRYAAYCIGIYEYLLKTTHPNNPLYPVDLPAWMKQTRHFTENTTFENLIIHDVQIGENTSLVTFTAVLKQRGKNVSFTEQSLFEKYEGKWLYKDGIYID
jgi:SEC-C motif-containing protein